MLGGRATRTPSPSGRRSSGRVSSPGRGSAVRSATSPRDPSTSFKTVDLSVSGQDEFSRSCVGISKEEALEWLFNIYDQDGNGVIDCEEFVWAEVTVNERVGRFLDPRQVELRFNEQLHRAYMQGEDQARGGLSFKYFAKWQSTLPVEAITQTAELLESVLGKSRENASPDLPLSALAPPKAKAPSRKGSTASGTGTSAVRKLQEKSSQPACSTCGQVIGKKNLKEFMDLFISLQLTAPPSSPAELSKTMELVSTNAEISWLAQELRHLSCERRCADPLQTVFITAQALSLRERLYFLSCRRQESLRDSLVLRGITTSGGKRLPSVTVDVSLRGKRLATVISDKQGAFEQRVTAKPGSRFTMTARKSGFAMACTHVGGGGVKNVRLDLLQFCIQGKFIAQPGDKNTAPFKDKSSGASFDVPVGALLKGGEPFAGEASFNAAVIDVTSPGGVAAMPPLTGRTLNGRATGMQSVGAVFTDLRDAYDGMLLDLGTSSIHCSLPSSAPLPQQPPSIWYYDDKEGEWIETMEKLQANGSYIPAPDRDVEAKTNIEEEDVDAHDEPLQEGKTKQTTCTCGYRAKLEIMPIVQNDFGMTLADPPKRLFAVTDPGGKHPFPYLLDDDSPTVCPDKVYASAKKLSSHPDVVFSQSIGEVYEVMNDRRSSDEASRRILPQLRRVIDWFLSKARAIDPETSEAVPDIAPAALRLALLEKLARMWVDPKAQEYEAVPGSTSQELKDLLENQGGDIAEALLNARQEQSLRYKVPEVCSMTGFELDCRDVFALLRSHGGDVTSVADVLENGPDAKKWTINSLKALVQQKCQQMERDWSDTGPTASGLKPTNSQLEHALAKYIDEAVAARRKDRRNKFDRFASEAVDNLRKDPDVKSWKIDNNAWKKILNEKAAGVNYSFDVNKLGWTNCDCSQINICMVFGVLEEAFAAQVEAVGVTYRGIDFAGEVEPDGSFNIMCAGGAQFMVDVKHADGSPIHSCGPYMSSAGSCNVGMLKPAAVKTDSAAVEAAKVKILWTSLPFQRGGSSRWDGLWAYVHMHSEEGEVTSEVLTEQCSKNNLPNAKSTFRLTSTGPKTLLFQQGDWKSSHNLDSSYELALYGIRGPDGRVGNLSCRMECYEYDDCEESLEEADSMTVVWSFSEDPKNFEDEGSWPYKREYGVGVFSCRRCECECFGYFDKRRHDYGDEM